MEGNILPGQPGGGFEVGKATCFFAPAGLFLASKFAANSVVQDISKSFLFFCFPSGTSQFFCTFVLTVWSLLLPTLPTWWGLLGKWQRFCGAFWDQTVSFKCG